MRDIPSALLILVIVAFFMNSTATQSAENTRKADLVSNMTQVAQSTAVESMDYSSRIERATVYMNEGIFEDNFKTNFDKVNNINMGSYNLEFEYLKDDEITKAIRITLTDDRGQDYTSTVATDIPNN